MFMIFGYNLKHIFYGLIAIGFLIYFLIIISKLLRPEQVFSDGGCQYCGNESCYKKDNKEVCTNCGKSSVFIEVKKD